MSAEDALQKVVSEWQDDPMSDAARAVIGTVLAALRAVDDRWLSKQLPGTPSITDYAQGSIDRLRSQYGRFL